VDKLEDTTFNGKHLVFMPRLSGKTFLQMKHIQEDLKNGVHVVVITKDCTTEIKPVVRCKDCKIRGKGIACHYATGDDWFCADGVPKKGERE